MLEVINNILENRKILILGFGREGQSTFRFLMKCFPGNEVAVADSNPDILEKTGIEITKNVPFYSGISYLDNANNYDIIIKSPGIPVNLLKDKIPDRKITSQTGLFLTQFRNQVVGITGTKGKSTTSSLIYHLLKKRYKNLLLVGNIGVPPLDMIEDIKEDTPVIFEMSSHQLENITVSPRISVLLNLFEEHLDHYNGLTEYHFAKLNIMRFQKPGDTFICSADDPTIRDLLANEIIKGDCLPYSLLKKLENGIFTDDGKLVVAYGDSRTEYDFRKRQNLPGDHNLKNIMASVAVAKILGVKDDEIREAVMDFKGLPHRLEYIGTFRDIHFYNDSIATIPEATIEAVKTLKSVDTLIIGGKDRGIDYDILIDFIVTSGLKNIIFTGDAGKRVLDGVINKGNINGINLFFVNNFDEIADIVRENTSPGSICLLSPAASSYDMFVNFEERGEAFKKIAENL